MPVGKTQIEYDFVIVGSGAGGGPLAANLALEGYAVLLIEAGGKKSNDNYYVPAFHGKCTEDPEFSWEFFVKHYSKNPQRDKKYHTERKDLPGAPGIFYPRATGLGGCTIHHAMITVYPHESDWNFIAKEVGDKSWNAHNMRKYFDRIEVVQNKGANALRAILDFDSFPEAIRGLTSNALGQEARGAKGNGWLPVSQADPLLLAHDRQLLKIVATAYKISRQHKLKIMPGLDPNHPKVARGNLEGINVIPISVENGRRSGSRERVLDARELLLNQTAQGKKVGRLDFVTDTFATNIVFAKNDKKKAVGVRCVHGSALYAARHHKVPGGQPGASIEYRAKKEVILCGGAFNTPQILMLSGIGPADELKKHGIPIRVNLKGVGRNLQDRYEIGVVGQAREKFQLLKEAPFKGRKQPGSPDPVDSTYKKWREQGKGIYATNGAVLGIIMRSTTQKKPNDPPDLYIFGLPGYFRGYEIGYSRKATADAYKDRFTWAVLKGHTDNRSGYLKLNSSNPFHTPDIHFKYFDESDQNDSKDVQSVIDGVKFVQEIFKELEKEKVIIKQEAPEPEEDLEQFVRNNAWGHHASCTCKIGADGDDMAVLDKDFQVRGVKNLRVVDASVFPRIPGLFILASVYMISEKASDVIIQKYKSINPDS